MSNKFVRFFIGLIMKLFPTTRWHEARRILLNMAGHQIASDVKINGDVRIYGNGVVEIGANTWISVGCVFVTHPDAPISISANCDIGPFVSFVTGSHAVGSCHRRAGEGVAKPIVIGSGSWVGARGTILGGARVGPGTVIGAQALVREGIYANSVLLTGIPAVEKKKYDDN